MTVHVTQCAIDRYVECVGGVSADAARAAILSAGRAIEQAGAIGAHTVRLGNGARLVIRSDGQLRVVTVLGRGHFNAADVAHPTPTLCGLCGVRCSHPIAGACVRAECPLGSARLGANDQPRRKS